MPESEPSSDEFCLTENEARDRLECRGFRLETGPKGERYRIRSLRTGDIVEGGYPKPFSLTLADVQAWLAETGE